MKEPVEPVIGFQSPPTDTCHPSPSRPRHSTSVLPRRSSVFSRVFPPSACGGCSLAPPPPPGGRQHPPLPLSLGFTPPPQPTPAAPPRAQPPHPPQPGRQTAKPADATASRKPAATPPPGPANRAGGTAATRLAATPHPHRARLPGDPQLAATRHRPASPRPLCQALAVSLESTAKLLRPVGVSASVALRMVVITSAGAYRQGACLHHDRVALGADAGRLDGAVNAVEDVAVRTWSAAARAWGGGRNAAGKRRIRARRVPR